MFFVDGVWLLLLGVLAVPGLIIAKRPDAQKIIDKIAPYQGWIGAISVIWGVFRLFFWFTLFGQLGRLGGIIYFIIYSAYILCMIVLGFLLGIGVMKTFIKDANARAKMDQTLAKLAPKQGILGLIALIDGVALLVVTIIPSILS